MKRNDVVEIIHLTDIHGTDFLIHEIGSELEDVDLVVISGDITHFGREKDAEKVIYTVKQYNPSILAVSGNCDFPQVEDYLLASDINLHRTIRNFAGFTFNFTEGVSNNIYISFCIFLPTLTTHPLISRCD